MPKLSISQLENARKNPMQMAKQLSDLGEKKINFAPTSKYKDWQNAVTKFHNTGNKGTAITYLSDAFRQHFKDTKKNERDLDDYTLKLEQYMKDVEDKGLFLDEKNKNISIDFNPKLSISGRIPLLYLNSDNGYSVFFFEKEDVPWEDELRFPVIQNFIAKDVFDCPLSQVQVGVYCLALGEHIAKSYTDSEVAASVNELHELGNTIVSYF